MVLIRRINVNRLCNSRIENLIINRDVSGGYCKTAVRCSASHKILKDEKEICNTKCNK